MIFPFIDGVTTDTATQTTTEVTTPKEYAWDFENNELILEDGKPVVLEGLEAIKVWIYKALNTQRFKYLAYSWDYGHEFDSLVGRNNTTKQLIDSEAKRFVEEALLVNSHISGIKNLSVTLADGVLNMGFTVITDQGEALINV